MLFHRTYPSQTSLRPSSHFFQTFGKYIVFQTDNFLQPVIKITFHMCPASQREHISVIDFTMSRLTTSITFNPCGVFFKDNLINRLNDFKYHYSDMCPAVAHICHRLHYVPINHINDFFKVH